MNFLKDKRKKECGILQIDSHKKMLIPCLVNQFRYLDIYEAQEKMQLLVYGR